MVPEEEAPHVTEMEPLSAEDESFTTSEEEDIPSDEEPHVLLAAFTSITSPSRLTLDMEREPSPLPSQLLVPE